jgi:hypothetical protein
MKKINENARKVLAMLRQANGKISAIGLFRLIRITSAIDSPTFAVLHNYTSDKSDKTELADYVLNVGTKYERAKETSIRKIENLGTADIMAIQQICTPETIKGFQYINRKGLSEIGYCNEVKLAVPQAIEEMKTVVSTPNVNEIHLNKVLKYNTNTGNLLLSGELISGGKTTTVKAEPKFTAKAPLTVAKEVVRGYLNTRTNNIRSFRIDNLNTVSVANHKIELVAI